MTASGQALVVERAGGVATVTLNRPGARNALSAALVLGLRDALAELDADEEVGAVVLTGSDPAFCAGLDLKELGSTGANLDLGRNPDGVPPGYPWAPLSTPLIGAVNGVAITGGLELALHCDLLIASDRAAFADTHARVGLVPGWGASVLLPAAVGARVARQMSLTGDFLSPRTRCGPGSSVRSFRTRSCCRACMSSPARSPATIPPPLACCSRRRTRSPRGCTARGSRSRPQLAGPGWSAASTRRRLSSAARRSWREGAARGLAGDVHALRAVRQRRPRRRRP